MIPEQDVSLVPGDGAVLEARLALPPGAAAGVVICHPHPLYGGDMDNPVVQCVVEACAEAGVATLRFNFRGVGASTGSHDAGRAEQLDLSAALDDLGRRLGSPAIAAAGYSFGAMVTAAVAAHRATLRGVALIAPPLAHRGLPLEGLVALPATLIAYGDHDEHCPPGAVAAITAALPDAEVRMIAGTDHFFARALGRLGEIVGTWARSLRTRDTAGRRRSG